MTSTFLRVLAVCVALSGCGFQIRGTGNFPQSMTAVYVDAHNRHSAFYRELTTRIRRSELELMQDRGDADTVIRIIKDETGRRPLTVSARNVPREFEVFYLVRYSVTVADRRETSPQQLILTRNYTYDETRVLGKAREEDVLRRALATDLVGLLVQQVSAIN
ncbi:MAG: LPS assembly lipoprotein LptE [Gammaproteobacteria bacterium]